MLSQRRESSKRELSGWCVVKYVPKKKQQAELDDERMDISRESQFLTALKTISFERWLECTYTLESTSLIDHDRALRRKLRI